MLFKTKELVLLLIVFSIFVSVTNSQNRLTVVKYKILDNKTNSKISLSKKDSLLSKNFIKSLEYLDQVECELVFNNEMSLYNIIPKISLRDNFDYKIAKAVAGGIHFKDISKKIKINQTNSFGSKLNITQDFNNLVWSITKETKKIGEYKCYKATTYKLDYNPIKKKYKKFKIIAWFTNDIPVSFGPKGIDGLPGLVLEASISNRFTFYVSSIKTNILDSSNRLSIPKADKELTIKQYEKMLEERYSSFKRKK